MKARVSQYRPGGRLFNRFLEPPLASYRPFQILLALSIERKNRASAICAEAAGGLTIFRSLSPLPAALPMKTFTLN